MNILFDDAMPYGREFFTSLGDAYSYKAGQMDLSLLAEAEVLLVRSTTKVDEQLLALAPKLRFVGTATAGFDHINRDALQEKNIELAVAAGCNAIAVAQYVVSALMYLASADAFELQTKKVAIVGAGKTGTALSMFLNALDIPYILYDPPAQESGDTRSFCHFSDVMQSDIISLHTPLVRNGKYPSADMFAQQQLSQLSAQQYLINACRGEVVNNHDLLTLFEQGKSLNVVLDVWHNEPNIDVRLIPHVRLATAHIAGHTLEGKARGTSMLYQDLCRWLNLPESLSLNTFLPSYDFTSPPKLFSRDSIKDNVHDCCRQIYDIAKDDRVFRSSMAQSTSFKDIRRNYHERREYSAAKLAGYKTLNLDPRLQQYNNKSVQILKNLGFIITD